jgi:hypothetical protein
VRMKPCSSRSTSGGSHSVCGRAPIMRTSPPRMGMKVVCFVQQVASGHPESHCPARINATSSPAADSSSRRRLPDWPPRPGRPGRRCVRFRPYRHR